MTHAYIPVTLPVKNQNIDISYSIKGVNNIEEYNQCIKNIQCGIELINNNKNEYLINVYNPRLIHDFNTAFEELKKKINSEDYYKAKFIIRASDINLDRLS